jgi:tetratricopeptide (TPR) repeat protein
MQASTALPKTSVRREAVLIAVLSAIAVVGLVIVFALVSRFRIWQSVLAGRTYQHGLNEMRFGNPGEAVEYFRSTLAFQPDDFDYQFSLAQALETAGRFDEAEAYLRNLWERQPQSGSVNLQLARLAAHRDQTTDVLRYYHNAIYGIWKSDSDRSRWEARTELVNYLISKNDVTQAQAELIAMQAGLPADPDLHMQVANLFAKIQDYEHALAEYRQVRQLDRKNVQAAAQAGIAAFKLGHFRSAQHSLEAALYGGDRDPTVRNLLETTWMIFSASPFRRGLSLQDRMARVRSNFQTAVHRLETCMAAHGESTPSASSPAAPAGPSAFQQLSTREDELKSDMRPRSALDDPDLREDVMDFVFDVEEQTETMCGPATGPDLALLLLGRSREVAEQ